MIRSTLLLTNRCSVLCALVLAICVGGQCQSSGTPAGIQIASTNEFGIDLATGNVHVDIPLRSNPVGPNPVAVSAVANFGVQLVPTRPARWTVPVQKFLPVAGGLLGVALSTETVQNYCGSSYQSPGTKYLGLTDSSGTFHGLSGYVNGVYEDHTFTLGPAAPNGECATSSQGVVVDGSGYTIASNYSTGESTIHDRPGYLGTYYNGTATVQTPDGVVVSKSGVTGTSSYAITDALTSTPLLTYTYSNVGNAQPGSNTYAYTDSSNNAQQYAVVAETPFTVNTNNFQCESYTSGATTIYLPTTISLPGTTGQYSITYESTPGVSGATTGRIAKITYPSGGSISYSYSGGESHGPPPAPTNSGYYCDSGVVPTLTVTTNDNNGNSAQWTYVNSNTTGATATFTVTRTGPPTSLSPHGDQVVYTFSGEYILEKQVYQGSATGTPLLTTVYCYNGNTTSCTAPTTAVVLPITEIDTYTTPGGYSKSTRTRVLYDAVYGNETYSANYDFGATTPTTQQYFYYGQSWNGTSCNAYPTGSYINSTPCYAKTTDGSGNILAQTKYAYSNTGHPTSTSVWVSGSAWLTTTRTYTAQGVIESITDTNTAQTTFSNYGCNSLVPQTITFPLASVGSASTVVDCNGGVTAQSTDVNGNIYQYYYADPLYRYTGVTKPDGGTESVFYGTSSLPWTVTTSETINSSETASTTTTFDGFGQVIEATTVDPSSSTGFNYTNIKYNNLGQKISVSNPFFTSSDPTYGVSTFAYDALGRVTQVTYPDSTSPTLTYLDRAIKSVDPSGLTIISQATGLTTHSDCLVTSTIQANGAGPSSCGLDIAGTGFLGTTSFDPLGRMTNSSLGTESRSYVYDGISRLTSETTPEGGTITFAYDTSSAGDLYQRTAPKANQTGTATTVTTYAWDSMHRPTGLSYTDGTPTVTISYDQASALGQSLANYKGQMTYAATGGTSTTNQSAFSYDNVERTAEVWSCTPLTCGTSVQKVGATYNYNDSPSTYTDYSTFPNRASPVTLSYSYNTAEQLTSVTSNYTPNGNFPGTLFTASSINALGELTKYTYASGAAANTTTLSYDTHGRNSSRSNGTLYSFSLGFYPNGTIQNSTDSTNGAWQYTYDGFGRLSTAVETSPAQSFAYQYDQYGNRWGANSACSSSNPSSCQYLFDSHNHITNGGITYDAAGNMTYDGIYSYTYDAEGRITKVSQGSTQITSYIYDALGRRSQATVGSSTYAFIFDFSGRPFEKLAYTQSTGEFFQQTLLYAGLLPIGFYESTCSTCTGGTQFFINDWKGTLSYITDQNGSNVGSCGGYLPFGDAGNCTGSGSTWSKPGYGGAWNDVETGLDKTDTRFLSSVQGRFLTPDPARSGWNLYVYGNNDPVSNTDSTGLDPWDGCEGLGCGPSMYDDFALGGFDFGLAQNSDVPVNPDPNTITTVPLVFQPGDIPYKNFGDNEEGLWSICNQCTGFYARAPEFIKEEILNSYTKPIGAPGFWGSLIPIYGSGRTAINDFQTGHWGWGLVNTGLAISDVFLVKSLATAGGKLAIAGIAALTERSAIGATGKVGEAALKELVGGVSQKYFKTALGRRFVDQFAEEVAHEAKTGYATLTPVIQKQIDKDAWLVKNFAQTGVRSAEWHFFESPVTGLVGPSGPLREALKVAGIKVVCPACP